MKMTTKVYKFMKMFASFKEYVLEEGKLIIDELAEGSEANMLNAEGELNAAPDGTYETEDGKITVADGKITSIETEKEPETVEEEIENEEKEEEEVVEEPKEEPKEEEETETTEEEPKEDPALVEAQNRITELEAKIAEYEAKIAELEAELNKPVEKPLEMKATPQNAPVNKKGVLKYFED